MTTPYNRDSIVVVLSAFGGLLKSNPMVYPVSIGYQIQVPYRAWGISLRHIANNMDVPTDQSHTLVFRYQGEHDVMDGVTFRTYELDVDSVK